MKSFKLISLLLIVTLVFFISGCGSNNKTTEKVETTEIEEVEPNTESNATSSSDVNTDDAINVVMEVNGGEKVELELYPNVAPETVANFVKLANEGFYDGLTFHRVIDGFMIQGGDPTGTGMGGSDETIVGEFSSNGFENDLSHERGVISMARSQDPDSASSQFFIVTDDSPFLDGEYAAFGRVTSGMEYVDQIVKTETDNNDKPLETQTIDRIYVVE